MNIELPKSCFSNDVDHIDDVSRRIANRERQAGLAMQRLAAMKTQKQRKQALAYLTDSDVIYEKLKSIADEKNEGDFF